jgi:hypothetical protein
MGDMKDETKAFEAMQADLEAKYVGRWILIHGGQLIGDFGDFEEAADHALEKFGRGPYLIRKVGEEPNPLPISVVYAWPNAQS